MPIQIPFPIPSHGYALNSKMRVNLDFLVAQFNSFNSGTATWDNVSVGTANNLTGTVTFYNASNAFYFTVQAGATNANTTLTLPANALPDPAINFMTFDSSGIGIWRSIGSFGFASNNESYVTMSSTGGLTAERVLTQGSGISISDGGANSTVTITNSGVTSITGTTNQVIRDVATGVVTLSLPQSIATSSLVQFGTVRTTTTGDGTNPSIAVYDSNTGWYRTSNDLYQILSGSIVSQTFFADLSTRFPKVVTASMVLRDTAGTNPTVTLNPPSSFTSYAMTLPTSNSSGTQFLTNNGSGVLSWSTPAGTGASTALDNLASVAINTSLLPASDNAIDLGSSSKNWRSLYVSTSIKNGSTTLATATELGYLTGVTSAIQTQLGLKAPLASPTFTGTVTAAILTTSGLYTPSAGIKGASGAGNAAAGNVGEVISATVAGGTAFPTSGNYGDATSILLTAGDWDVTAMIHGSANSTTVGQYNIGISTTSGNSSSGLTAGVNNLFEIFSANQNTSICVANYRVNINSSITHYLKIQGTWTGNNPNYGASIYARRAQPGT